MAEERAETRFETEPNENGSEESTKRARLDECESANNAIQAPEGLVSNQSSNSDQESFPEGAFQIGDLVFVAAHKQGKKEIEEGKVKVVKRYWNDNRDGVLYDIKYVLFNRTVKGVSSEYFRPEYVVVNDTELCEALAVKDILPANASESNWVRRSTRNAGNDQLGRPHVKELFERLEKDDPSLAILRLKNWLEADTNPQVLTRVFELVAKSKVVQALYVQNMEHGMDDERLKLLTKALIQNQRIWALNVGENFKITRKGWERFAEDLKKTGVTHIYAGSETTVYGELKVKMRDVVRANRSKHNLHVARDNLSVIMQIGQMWWNPRNSKIVQSYKSELADADNYKSGDHIILKETPDASWSFGKIVSLEDKTRYLVHIFGKKEEEKVYDLSDSKLAACNKYEPVLAEHHGRQWPALHFAEPHVVVFVNAKGKDLSYSVDAKPGQLTPFFLDEDELKRERNALWRDSMRATYELVYGKKQD